MTNPPRVMLLIDADNVSTDVIEQAISRLHAEYGALHVRRAYASAEAAVKHQKLFKRLSIRPMVNLAAGKNSTDIALAVDAIDLVLSERPDVVVIASSDSDFAPLVSRIREKGCLVRGIGQKGKVGEETPLIYDDFLVFEHHASRRHAGAAVDAAGTPAGKTRARRSAKAGQAEAVPPRAHAAAPKAARKRAGAKAAAAAGEPARSPADAPPKPPIDEEAAPPARRARKARPASKAAAEPTESAPAAAKKSTRRAATRKRPDAAAAAAEPAGEPAVMPAVMPAVEPVATPAVEPAGEAAPAPAPAPHLPEKVARAFEVLPALAAGERLDVQNAAAVLRKERVFSNADSWPKFFERYRDWFELTPPERPTHVQRRAPG